MQKTGEEVGDFLSNRIADRFTKVSRKSPQNSSEKVINEAKKEKDIYLLKRDKKLLII